MSLFELLPIHSNFKTEASTPDVGSATQDNIWKTVRQNGSVKIDYQYIKKASIHMFMFRQNPECTSQFLSQKCNQIESLTSFSFLMFCFSKFATRFMTLDPGTLEDLTQHQNKFTWK